MEQSMYIIMLLFTIILLFILIKYNFEFLSIPFISMLILTSISNLGYMQLSISETLETALFANKISYLGGCFIPYFMLKCICEICKYKLHKSTSIIAFFYCCLTYCLIYTTGFSPIYYAEVSLVNINNITRIIPTYGPLHNLYIVFLCCFFVTAFLIIIISFLRQTEVSYKTTSILFAMVVFSSSLYLLGTKLSCKTYVIPIIYFVDSITLLLLLYRIKIFDIPSLISSNIMETNEYGYIVFDAHKNYIGCNPKAKTFFKELISLKLDRHTWAKINSPLMKMITSKIHDLELGKTFSPTQLSCGDLKIKCTVKPIARKKFKRIIGYYVELLDDTEQCKYVELLTNYNTKLEVDVAEKISHIKKIQDDIILSMADIVEDRDSNTGGHVRRTSECVGILVQQLIQMPEYQSINIKFFDCVIKAAPLHDFGKIAIEDSILRKPGRFTDSEFEKMKEHSAKGAKIVNQLLHHIDDLEFKKIAVNIANYHHEKWNGTGYPEKLSGYQIPLEARIMAVADVFDALVSKRCYKNQYSFDDAFKIIEDSLGTHFDPTIGKAFIACRPQLESFYINFKQNNTIA